MDIQIESLMRTNEMKGDDLEDTQLLREMCREAEQYVLSFPWCSAVANSYLGLGVGGIVSVFLFEIVPCREEVKADADNSDNFIWVVIGDIPPSYVSSSEYKSPREALEGYVIEMQKWVDAAKSGDDISTLIPVNVEPTPANAELLEKRLTFIRQEILAHSATLL